VDTVLVEFGGELKLLGWTRFHAEAAALTFIGVDMDVTAGFRHWQFSILFRESWKL
jgi:uncharacterized membrane protein YagU involved in acid resistance